MLSLLLCVFLFFSHFFCACPSLSICSSAPLPYVSSYISFLSKLPPASAVISLSRRGACCLPSYLPLSLCIMCLSVLSLSHTLTPLCRPAHRSLFPPAISLPARPSFSTLSIMFACLLLPSPHLCLAVALLSNLLVYLCVCVCTDNSLAGSIH